MRTGNEEKQKDQMGNGEKGRMVVLPEKIGTVEDRKGMYVRVN